MNRVYYPCAEWEDWLAGMYRNTTEPAAIDRSVALLADQKRLAVAMREVTEKWPISTEHNLTNEDRNRRSWLGQAACCLAEKSSEIDTRIAWGRLTDEQRAAANAIADKVIADWEQSYHVDSLF